MTSSNDATLAEKPWDMVGRPSSSCASVWSTLLEGCCAKKSLSEPLGKPGSAPKLCAVAQQLSVLDAPDTLSFCTHDLHDLSQCTKDHSRLHELTPACP